jgi:signal transduction histidine kinase
MRTIECHGLSQPAGNRARDGSVWFGTVKGFVRIRPYHRAATSAPKVTVEQVSADGRPLPEGSTVLMAGARNVEVQYTALNLSSPGKIQFRYRMDGFDPDWVEAHSERIAHYNRLPPGNLIFLVAARNPGGAWSEPASLSIRQLPQFYQTWWFVLLAASAGAGLVAMAYRRRTQVLRARYEAVLSERNRIAREWHDTLVAGFSAISLQLEAIKSRLKQQPGRAEELIELTRRMVHHYRGEARRVIWDLRDSRPDSETLPEAVSNALHQVTDGRDVEGSLSIVGEPVRAPRELEHNVLRICQEALSNAIRHGEPRSLRLELEYTPAWLMVRVRDDGVGFEPDRMPGLTGHFGLTVMRERARRFGGTLRLESRPGDGTIVEAKVPLQAVERE